MSTNKLELLNKKYPLIGILGGMGPAATAEFFLRIIKKTPAIKDQDHIPLLIYNCPQISDRTRSIMTGDNKLLDELICGLQLLKQCGVKAIAIPCVSSHFYYDELAKSSCVPILNILDKTADDAARNLQSGSRVGVLGTDTTIYKKLFDKALIRNNLLPVTPSKDIQKHSVMRAIYLAKGGLFDKASEILLPALDELKASSIEGVIAGCTEISIILNTITDLRVIDSLDSLADAVINYAKANITE